MGLSGGLAANGGQSLVPIVDLPSSVGRAVSTDGTYGLPTPTGVGLESIIATVNGVAGLQDIQFNGASL